MGFSPADVKAMSAYEYAAAVRGFMKAHDTEQGLSKAEADEIWEWMQTKPSTTH